MTKAHPIIAKWVEVSQTYLTDGPPKRDDYEAILFANRCVVREGPKGRHLIRKLDTCSVFALTRKKLTIAVQKFLARDDVRLLVKGLETNDFNRLPRQSRRVSDGVVDGTADIYADKTSYAYASKPKTVSAQHEALV